MLWLQDLSRCRSFGMYVQNILLYYTHVMFLFLHLYWSNTIFLLVRHFLMLSGPKGILLNPNIVRLLQWQQYNGYSLSPIWRRQSWLFSLTHPFLFHLFSHSPDHFQFGHTTLIISPLCRFYSQLCTSIIGLCTVSTLINHGLISSTQWIITSTATPAGTCFIPTWGKKIMHRLSDALSNVAPHKFKSFKNWRHVQVQVPVQKDPSDSIFFAMKFLEFYDGEGHGALKTNFDTVSISIRFLFLAAFYLLYMAVLTCFNFLGSI